MPLSTEAPAAATSPNKVRAPLMPPYSIVRSLIAMLDGVPKATFTSLVKAIHTQTGTPQNPVDWTEPDVWIEERLSGEDKVLASRIWRESEGEVNPRYIYSCQLFFNLHRLLDVDSSGRFILGERGQAFVTSDASLLRELDDVEGLLHLLNMLAGRGKVMRGDLLEEWAAYLKEHSTFGSASTTKDTLRRRLVNLLDRGLILRDGNSYEISPLGTAYAASVETPGDTPRRSLNQEIQQYNGAQREALRDRLGKMPPYHFEQLVRDLLDAMGYEDVTVTKQSGDKGVDVTANIQFGITTIAEVVQVKRFAANVTRPVIDQLRGCLPYHKAIRGTLITLSDFSKGCAEAALFPGAPPISLINGDKLLDLMFKHEIGIKKRQVDFYDIDDDLLKSYGGLAAETPIEPD